MEKSEKLKNIIALSIGLLVLSLFFNKDYLVYIAAILLFLCIISDSFSDKLSWSLVKFSFLLSKIISGALLAVTFFLFLTPLALIARLFKGDFLEIKRLNRRTYYKERSHQYTPADFENMW